MGCSSTRRVLRAVRARDAARHPAARCWLLPWYRRCRSSASHFFITNVWNPVTSEFGALVPIYGTLVTSVIALLIAVPVSFGIALFLTETVARRG